MRKQWTGLIDSLTTEELQEALCVAIDDRKFDTSRLTPFPIILNACLGFIHLENQRSSLEFFHSTFQKWLLASGQLRSEQKPGYGSILLDVPHVRRFPRIV